MIDFMIEIPKEITITELGGEVWKLEDIKNLARSNYTAFNPSIAYSPTEGYAIAFRSSNYLIRPQVGLLELIEGDFITSTTWFASLDNDLNIKNIKQIIYSDEQVRGAEDPRLFWRDGSWHFVAVIYEPDLKKGSTNKPRLALYKYNEGKAELIEFYDYESLNPLGAEKNWICAYNKNTKFDYIYGANKVIKHGQIKNFSRPKKEIANLRGGSLLWEMPDKTYLAVAHESFSRKIEIGDTYTLQFQESILRNYFHRFVLYSNAGKILKISKRFQFHKPGIEYGAGLVVKDENVIISFGFRDYSSWLAKISLEKVMEMLEDV